jgi:hypothetical protein
MAFMTLLLKNSGIKSKDIKSKNKGGDDEYDVEHQSDDEDSMDDDESCVDDDEMNDDIEQESDQKEEKPMNKLLKNKNFIKMIKIALGK